MWKDTGTEDNPTSQAARTMLDAFTSTGAEHFDVTWTTRQGEKAGFRRHMPADTLRHLLPVMLSNAIKERTQPDCAARIPPRRVYPARRLEPCWSGAIEARRLPGTRNQPRQLPGMGSHS